MQRHSKNSTVRRSPSTVGPKATPYVRAAGRFEAGWAEESVRVEDCTDFDLPAFVPRYALHGAGIDTDGATV